MFSFIKTTIPAATIPATTIPATTIPAATTTATTALGPNQVVYTVDLSIY